MGDRTISSIWQVTNPGAGGSAIQPAGRAAIANWLLDGPVLALDVTQ